MNIAHQDRQGVAIRVSLEEARHLLAGLRERGAELGQAATALEQALTQAGVTPPEPPGHIRTEYMPPG